ncbi:MAG: hypothetical protein CFE45_19520, partial [Burkholderiales bacterium PBB5]
MPATVDVPQNLDAPPARGLWTPGMALLARWRFRARAAVISAGFALPVLLLVLALLDQLGSTVDFTRKERQGVAAMQALVPVLSGLVTTRNATRAMLGGVALQPDYIKARQATDEALAAFSQHLRTSGDPLALAKPLATLQQAWIATAQAKNGVDAQGRTVFGPVVAATVQLLNRIGDDSNLVLDPDVDSFYTVNALVLTLPRLIDDLGQVWGWSSFAAARGTLGSDAADRRFVGWAAGVHVYSNDLRSYTDRAVAANPALAKPLGLDALKPMEAYVDWAEAVVRGERRRDPAEQFAAGNGVVQSLFAIYAQALPALDEVLARREAALVQQRWRMLAAVVLCLLLSAYLFECFRRLLAQGLHQLTDHLGRMRRGDLTVAVHPGGRDEVADVTQALDDMRQGLVGIVAQVRRGAQALLQGAARVSDGATDLSARTERNAAALEQTAAAMEEIVGTVRHTAAHSRDAANLARENAVGAAEGGTLV